LHILLVLVYIALFTWLIFRWKFFRVKGVKRWYFAGAFGLKLLFGLALALIYSEHYTDRKTGDTYKFFDDAAAIHESRHAGMATYLRVLTASGLESDTTAMRYHRQTMHVDRAYQVGFINDNHTVIRANAMLMWVSGGHYYVHVVFWCFISLIGLTGLFKVLARYFPRKKAAMFFSVFLLPTVLFWGSGILKEPIFLLGLGLFALGFFSMIYNKIRWNNTLLTMAGGAVLILAKGYILLCMLPAIAGLLLAKANGGRRFWLWFAIPHAVALMLLFILPHIDPGYNVADYMRQKQEAFYNVAELSGSGSTLKIPPISSPADVVTYSPGAMARSYLRPWPWEWTKATYIPAALENLALLICLLAMIWNFRRPYGLEIPIFAFCLSFVLMIGILVGEVVPVLGAIVRYKMPGLIFLFAAIFMCTDHIMFQRRLPFMRRIIRRL
jgi:hypothetical protein